MRRHWKKIVLGYTAAVLLFYAGRTLVRALQSDETKIRRCIATMVEGFNETRLDDVLAGLAPDFRDDASGITRAELREVLVYSFLQDYDGTDRSYLYTAELAPEELVVEVVGGEPPQAKVALHCVFRTKRGVFWDARVEGEMSEGERGWQWVRTTAVNHSDRRRAR